MNFYLNLDLILISSQTLPDDVHFSVLKKTERIGWGTKLSGRQLPLPTYPQSKCLTQQS